jgi:hypothetical protein
MRLTDSLHSLKRLLPNPDGISTFTPVPKLLAG